MTEQATSPLTAALAKAQAEMKPAKFNRINPHFKNRYADLASIIEATRTPLASNGLAVSQMLRERGGEGFFLVTTLRHLGGEELVSEYPLPHPGNPQQFGSALTYARRYSLSAICCIAADEDDDAEAAVKGGNGNGGGYVTEQQADAISDMIEEVGADRAKFLNYLKVNSLMELPAAKFKNAIEALNAKRNGNGGAPRDH